MNILRQMLNTIQGKWTVFNPKIKKSVIVTETRFAIVQSMVPHLLISHVGDIRIGKAWKVILKTCMTGSLNIAESNLSYKKSIAGYIESPNKESDAYVVEHVRLCTAQACCNRVNEVHSYVCSSMTSMKSLLTMHYVIAY